MKPAYFEIARDALALIPRLVGTAVQVKWGQLFSRPPQWLDRFTSLDWLAEQLDLDRELIKGASIAEVHTGTASRSRLHIQYAQYAGDLSQPPGPASLFVKSSPPDFASALFGVLLNLGGNEVSFYRHIRPGLPVKSPQVLYCEGDSRDYVLLLEDLTEKGCNFRDLTSKCSLDEATSVVTTLAHLHAKFWKSERFATDLAWVARLETNQNFRLLNLLRQLSVPSAYNKYGEILPPALHEFIAPLLANYQRLEGLWAQEPRTLIHGDAHLGNMYFQDGEAGLLDWQVMQQGQGMRDVSYFLINSLEEELRLAHQERLIKSYLATLSALGVSFSFDTAWLQYRLHSVYAWIAAVVTAQSNFQPESVVVSSLTRASRAIVDLDVVALIREL